MSEKIRACPFCGSEDVKLWSGNWEGYAICLNCGAQGPKVETDDAGLQTRDKMATRLWSMRTHDRLLEHVDHELHDYTDDWLLDLLREEMW